MPEADVIRSMFARVADRYDRANRWLSLGVDRSWRRAAVRLAAIGPGARVLDACTGTGDLALEFARSGASVTGTDFCGEMLLHAARKDGRADGHVRAPGRARFVIADTLALPFRDGSFDVATVAFGIRNVADPVAGLRELSRVVRPGGSVVVLEFCKPRTPGVRQAYLLYFRRVLPWLGRWISGDRGGAYDYLPQSVMAFPERNQFLDLMTRAGLEAAEFKPLSLGIAGLYRGRKPGSTA